jgi:hypothetical protein
LDPCVALVWECTEERAVPKERIPWKWVELHMAGRDTLGTMEEGIAMIELAILCFLPIPLERIRSRIDNDG